MRRAIVVSLCGAAGILASSGCASAPVPSKQLIQSEAAVKSVEAVDTENSPKARLYLEKARTSLKSARSLIEDGDHEDAHRALEKAEYDARLALAIAKEDQMRAELGRINKEIDALRVRTMEEGIK